LVLSVSGGGPGMVLRRGCPARPALIRTRAALLDRRLATVAPVAAVFVPTLLVRALSCVAEFCSDE
jgi:hypothetical protein